MIDRCTPTTILPFPSTRTTPTPAPKRTRRTRTPKAEVHTFPAPPPQSHAPLMDGHETYEMAREVILHFMRASDDQKRALLEYSRSLSATVGLSAHEAQMVANTVRIAAQMDDEARVDLWAYARCRLRRQMEK